MGKRGLTSLIHEAPLPVKKHSYTYEELILAGEGKLFGEGKARLPLPNMLMMDRITHVSEMGGAHGKGQLVAELDIHPDLWFFKCHFKDDPVMPGCLGLDALWQLSGFFLTWTGHPGKGRALGVGEVKYRGQILPTNKLVTYTIDVKRVLTSKLIMIITDGTVAVDGRPVYWADSLRVGLFESTEDF